MLLEFQIDLLTDRWLQAALTYGPMLCGVYLFGTTLRDLVAIRKVGLNPRKEALEQVLMQTVGGLMFVVLGCFFLYLNHSDWSAVFQRVEITDKQSNKGNLSFHYIDDAGEKTLLGFWSGLSSSLC